MNVVRRLVSFVAFIGMVVLPSLTMADATTLWTKTTANDTIGGWQEVVAVSDGIFAGCATLESNGDYFATVRCWDENGTTLWTYQLPDPNGSYFDRLYRVRVAPDGTLVAVGSSNRVQSGRDDLLLIRLDAQGTLIQSSCIATNANGVNGADDLAFDSSGNLYISYSQTGRAQYDFSKFSPTFSLLWHLETNQVLDAEVLPNGNVAVCGQVFPATVAIPFFAILAPNGTTVFQQVWPGDTDCAAYDLATTSSSRVYVARTSSSGVQRIDLYTGTGTLLGSTDVNAVLYASCQLAYHEQTDSLYFVGTEVGNNLRLFRFNGVGQEQWNRSRDVSIVGGVTLLALDRFGNAVIASRLNPGTNHNLAAWCFSVAGEQQWFNQLTGMDTTDEGPAGLAIDNQLRLVVAGRSYPAGNPNGLNQGLLWRTSQFFNAKPSNMVLKCGLVSAGTLDSLGRDDGDELAIKRFAIRSTEVDYIKAEFDTQFPIGEANPGTTDFRFVIRARSNTPGMVGTVQLWDYNAGAWANTTPINLGVSESLLEIPVTNMSRYIQNGSRRVKARLYVAPQGAATPRNLTVRIDQIAWRSDT